MINGTLSRIIYIGALMLIGLIVVSMVYLTTQQLETPTDIKVMLGTLVGMIAGSQITPPNVRKVTGETTEPGTVGAEPAATYVAKRLD